MREELKKSNETLPCAMVPIADIEGINALLHELRLPKEEWDFAKIIILVSSLLRRLRIAENLDVVRKDVRAAYDNVDKVDLEDCDKSEIWTTKVLKDFFK